MHWYLLFFRFCSELTRFILVLIQVLHWAREEDKMEKLKARLIELYYENLFKVISLPFCATLCSIYNIIITFN